MSTSSSPLSRLALRLSREANDIDGSTMDGGLDRELKRDTFPLSPPLAGPELSSLLLPTFTLDNHASVVIWADRPPTYPLLIVPPLSFSAPETVTLFVPNLEFERIKAFSEECRKALSFVGRSGWNARTSANIDRWPTGAERAGGRSDAMGGLLKETRSSYGVGGDVTAGVAGVEAVPTFCSEFSECGSDFPGRRDNIPPSLQYLLARIVVFYPSTK